MKNILHAISRRLRRPQPVVWPTHGVEGIKEMGHRTYVGGLWDEIGKLQLTYLLSRGLKPEHYLMDIACGSLRAGVHFIPYLDVGHYLGIDKEQDLIDAGIEKELGRELYEARKPQFVVSGAFEFEKFGIQPDFSIAQSLFTHLPAPVVHQCFKKLRAVVHDQSVFYATFVETDKREKNPETPHDHMKFVYTREEMAAFGTENGWRFEYIGNWNHPRNQMITCYRPA